MSSFLSPLPGRDELSLNGITLRYALRLSPRRSTLCVQVFPDGAVRVMAPLRARRSEIESFLAQRWGWIQSKRHTLAERARQSPASMLADGAHLPVLGEALTLRQRLGDGNKPSAMRHGRELVVSAPTSGHIPALVIRWYRQTAHRHVSERLLHYSPLVGRAPARLSIRGQKTRWGSCSARGTISINWRLMQASAEILDYVVVHELCHLLHPNHSPRFWKEVGRVMPDYPRVRRELRTFGLSVVL